MKGFADLGLREEILTAIAEAGYTAPTPIQAQAIPHILEGRDLVGIAQTGTGKTASFTLPMLHQLAAGRARARMPRSLILSPTRELATQTARNFEIYGKHLKLSMALLIGGVGMGEQERVLEKGVEVLIATPGRLLDWFDRGRVLLGGVEILVIDEADRMLDMGFIPDVERIVSLLLRRRQTLLFSATMPPEVRRLADRFLRDPVIVEVAPPSRKSALVEDRLVPAPATRKRDALLTLLRTEQISTAMIFCNTKREVSALARFLSRNGIEARDIHGGLDQSVRQATLDAFGRGEVAFLVATDVAARGLDIQDMPVVINFDVPHAPDDYVHRIGRTGRAGRKGRAYTLITRADARAVAAIERHLKRSIPRLELADIASQAEEDGAKGEQRGAARTAAASSGPSKERTVRKEPASSPVAAMSARAGSPSRTTASGKTGRGKASEAAVIGLGEHVPRFLQRVVPIRPASKTGTE